MLKFSASLALATSLIASTSFADSSCCEPDCCSAPDCSYAFNPQFYSLECDWGLFANVDFLYWYGRETDLLLGEKGVIISPGPAYNSSNSNVYLFVSDRQNLAPLKQECFDAKWEPGVRVGLGFNSCCDGWDLGLSWTYYHNKESESMKVNAGEPGVFIGDEFLTSPWVRVSTTPASAGILNRRFFPTYIFNSIRGEWNFTLNSLDLALGRRFWISPCVTLRPYLGLQGAWTRTRLKFRSQAESEINEETEQAGISSDLLDEFKNKFWGVGLVFGIGSDWRLGCGFSLFGDASFSLLQGEYKRSKKENYFATVSPEGFLPTNPQSDPFNVLDFQHETDDSKCFAMQPIVDFEIGLRYSTDFCCCRYLFSVDLAWEQQYWFDHTTRVIYSGVELGELAQNVNNPFAPPIPVPQANFSYSENFNKDITSLILGGLRLGVRLDF